MFFHGIAPIDVVLNSCESYSTEFLGFNNRTCTSSLLPKKTAGPVLRGSGSLLWREWLIRVLKNEKDGQQRIHISLQAFVDPKLENPKCLGFVSNFYENPEYIGTCVIPPHGNHLFLNDTQDLGCDGSSNPQVWWVLPAASGAEGEFELQSANKPDMCARTLAVEDCGYQSVLVEDTSTGTREHKAWKLTRRYDAMYPPPPPSPPPPPPPPTMPQEIPGPVISGPSSTSNGYAKIVVESPGGNSACSVVSIVISSSAVGSAENDATLVQIGVTQSFVPVPVSRGYNFIHATGLCSGGETTERSNELTTFSQPANPIPPLAFTTDVSNFFRRKLLASNQLTTYRCFFGGDGNFTNCADSGLPASTFLIDGVVGPTKKWLTFAGVETDGIQRNLVTYRLGYEQKVVSNSRQVSYSTPNGYEFYTQAFDPLGRRVWFTLTPSPSRRSLSISRGERSRASSSNFFLQDKVLERMKAKLKGGQQVVSAVPSEYFGTCAIDPQGVYFGCTQSTVVTSANLVGPGQDSSGFYASNSTTGALEFCANDMSFPCSLVSGVAPYLEVFQLKFLTDTQAYLTVFNDTSNSYVTLRCDVPNPTTFRNCQTAVDVPYAVVLFLNPANNGANAYNFVVDFLNQKVFYTVCSIVASTGAFENCIEISKALPFFITSPAFSSPITF